MSMDNNKHVVVWEGLDARSMECLCWQKDGEFINISSCLSGVTGTVPFGIHYKLEIHTHWVVYKAQVKDLMSDMEIHLESDGKGKWKRGREPLDIADGCLDLDLGLTPFTNSLPIRRLAWKPGQRQTIQALHIGLPDFTLTRSEQHYTKLSGKSFLFETGDHFTAELSLDEDQLVIGYPGIAQRVFP
jgi:hypothetical protein